MSTFKLIFLIAALAWGCENSAIKSTSHNPLTRQSKTTEKTAATMKKKPMKPLQFIPGPKIKPTRQLLDWLNKKAKMISGRRRRIRLPVVIRFEDSFRLSIRDAFVGVSGAYPNKDMLLLSLNDAALGIPLLSRLRDSCSTKRNWCAVWLEGLWGPLIELKQPEQEKEDLTEWLFSVLKVGKLVEKKLGHDKDVRIFIESS